MVNLNNSSKEPTAKRLVTERRNEKKSELVFSPFPPLLPVCLYYYPSLCFECSSSERCRLISSPRKRSVAKLFKSRFKASLEHSKSSFCQMKLAIFITRIRIPTLKSSFCGRFESLTFFLPFVPSFSLPCLGKGKSGFCDQI